MLQIATGRAIQDLPIVVKVTVTSLVENSRCRLFPNGFKQQAWRRSQLLHAKEEVAGASPAIW